MKLVTVIIVLIGGLVAQDTNVAQDTIVAHGHKTCDQLPKDIVCDCRKTCEPHGRKWELYKSTDNSKTCFMMGYEGNRNNNKSMATMTMYHKNPKYYVPLKVEVNKEMTAWTVTADDGPSIVSHRLLANFKDNYWCIYWCDATDKKYMGEIVCAYLHGRNETRNAERRKMLDRDLETHFPNLLFKPDQKLNIVYNDDCRLQ